MHHIFYMKTVNIRSIMKSNIISTMNLEVYDEIFIDCFIANSLYLYIYQIVKEMMKLYKMTKVTI